MSLIKDHATIWYLYWEQNHQNVIIFDTFWIRGVFFYLGKCAVFCFCTLVSKSAIAVHLTIVILPLWMHSLASLNEVNENLGVDSIKYLANKLSHPIFPKPSDWIFGLFFLYFSCCSGYQRFLKISL